MPSTGTSTSFPLRLWAVGWKLVLFVGLFLALYIPFVMPYLLFPDTEYQTLASASARATIELLAASCVVLTALAMTRYVDRAPFTRLGLALRGMLPGLTFGMLLGTGVAVLILGLLTLQGSVTIGSGSGPLKSDFFWVTLALFFNSAAQEVMVHGYVQQMVRRNLGTHVSVMVSAAVLMLLHYTLFHADTILLLTNLFVAGVFLGLAFLWRRSLWLPIGIHFGWNYIQGPILGLPVTGIDLWDSDLVAIQGSDFVTGGKFGIEGGIIATLVLFASVAILYEVVRRKRLTQPDWETRFP